MAVKKKPAKKMFKPCSGCPTPAACKKMGRCKMKSGKKY